MSKKNQFDAVHYKKVGVALQKIGATVLKQSEGLEAQDVVPLNLQLAGRAAGTALLGAMACIEKSEGFRTAKDKIKFRNDQLEKFLNVISNTVTAVMGEAVPEFQARFEFAATDGDCAPDCPECPAPEGTVIQ